MFGFLGRVLWPIVLLLVASLPTAAGAFPVAARQTCHAPAGEAERWQAVVAHTARWQCDGAGWSLSDQATMLRFDLDTSDGRVLPQSIVTHTGYFERIDIGIVSASGDFRWSSWWPRDTRHLGTGPFMSIPIADVDSETRLVLVRVVRPWGKTMMTQMRLDSDPIGSGWPLARIVGMAAICGMLVVPLLVNAAFYAVLRERFVIWHLAMAGSMLVQAACATGFIHLAVGVPPLLAMQANNIATMAMVAAALMFSATFIEVDALDVRLRKAVTRFAPVVLASGVVLSIPIGVIRPISATMLSLIAAVAVILILAMLYDAHRRGSCSVKFQIIGWSPLICVAIWRIASNIVPGLRPTEAVEVYHLALALEVLVTAFGIVSRFVLVRQERDLATARAIELEGVAGRDPLTGLRNRRSIERRFDELFRTGFRTMALIDLDHFKTVNDTHGHAIGDDVLRAAARALVDDRDTKAIRMGGEEFLLLLRGSDSVARAERCRRAITARVAAKTPALDRLVTASMGVVEHDPRGSLEIDFATLYSQCDKLLYEAKRLGRNCTMKERVRGFQPTVRAVA